MTQVLSSLYQEEHEFLKLHHAYKIMESVVILNNQGLVKTNTRRIWKYLYPYYKG